MPMDPNMLNGKKERANLTFLSNIPFCADKKSRARDWNPVSHFICCTLEKHFEKRYYQINSSNIVPFNVRFKIIPDTLEKQFQDLFPSFRNGLVRGEPGGFVRRASFTEEMAKEIWEMQTREDDVWLITYPKSGTCLNL